MNIRGEVGGVKKKKKNCSRPYDFGASSSIFFLLRLPFLSPRRTTFLLPPIRKECRGWRANLVQMLSTNDDT